jgi:hypothetical protein
MFQSLSLNATVFQGRSIQQAVAFASSVRRTQKKGFTQKRAEEENEKEIGRRQGMLGLFLVK